MPFLPDNYRHIRKELDECGVSLVAVSKFKSQADIVQAYEAGQYDFGENYVQELIEKQKALPHDIRWHFIGHLQTNKVKQIATLVYLIHGVDSLKLLLEINKQGQKINRIIPCLLQVHIAQEETKFGFDENELFNIDPESFSHVEVKGLMGMASFTDKQDIVRAEFKNLHRLYSLYKLQYPSIHILSMGMSNDYKIAVEEGSNMVRIGSLIFGERKA